LPFRSEKCEAREKSKNPKKGEKAKNGKKMKNLTKKKAKICSHFFLSLSREKTQASLRKEEEEEARE